MTEDYVIYKDTSFIVDLYEEVKGVTTPMCSDL